MTDILSDAVEAGTRRFLMVMQAECRRRHGGSRVPGFDELAPVDRAIMLNAVGQAIDAAKKAEREASGSPVANRTPA